MLRAMLPSISLHFAAAAPLLRYDVDFAAEMFAAAMPAAAAVTRHASATSCSTRHATTFMLITLSMILCLRHCLPPAADDMP